MQLATARILIGDDDLTDDEIKILLNKAQQQALNWYFWKLDDEPTADEEDQFLDKWDYEITDLAKAINDENARGGLTSYTELGVTRTWASGTGDSNSVITKALSAIPRKVYVL